MRVGTTLIPNSNANYRAIDPLKAMMRRGHEVVWPTGKDGETDPRSLASCDAVHVHRRADPHTRRMLAGLSKAGVGITFDNDDDLIALPKESPDYRRFGGLTGQRLWTDSIKAARQADVFTTTTEVLADRYRSAGVGR